MKVQLFRNGSLIADLTNEESYDLETPVSFDYDQPILMLPGDEIVTRCVFNSESSDDWVYYGDGTSDEMCYGYLTMYPRSSLRSTQQNCVATSTLSACELAQGVPYNGCDWKTLIKPGNPSVTQMINELYDNCDYGETCIPECKAVISKIASSNVCFQGNNLQFLRSLADVTEQVFEIVEHLQWCPVTVG
uniref:Copper type II ascorbate-dependent monooxygenase C-terminal domain-containing protein n=1 Tax=Biomphalaria glabrata TaxID=6526 RepID=A0A2C9LTB6_BIOGL